MPRYVHVLSYTPTNFHDYLGTSVGKHTFPIQSYVNFEYTAYYTGITQGGLDGYIRLGRRNDVVFGGTQVWELSISTQKNKLKSALFYVEARGKQWVAQNLVGADENA